MSKSAWYLVGCLTIPVSYVGGRLLGNAIGFAYKARWL